MASALELMMAKREAAKAAAAAKADPPPAASKAEELKAEVEELPKALVEASAGDRVNPPESVDALPASLGAAPAEEPKGKGRGKGRKAADVSEGPSPTAAAIEGKIVDANVDHGTPQATILFPDGTIIPVGARVRIEVLG